MQPVHDLGGLLALAGWTMAPLYACSMVAATVSARKLVEFITEGVVGRDARVLREASLTPPRTLEELARLWEDTRTPLARVLAATARAARSDPDRAEAAALHAANEELDRYEGWLPLLAYVAQIAPLFGLLGTVAGMVELFASMEASGAAVSSAQLSAGIWKALLTTAAGLMVAIPTLGAHIWFTRVLEQLRRRMERGVARLLDGRTP